MAWNSRPIATTDQDVEDMRYGYHRGQRLCERCGENYATTTDRDGDQLCGSCA